MVRSRTAALESWLSTATPSLETFVTDSARRLFARRICSSRLSSSSSSAWFFCSPACAVPSSSCLSSASRRRSCISCDSSASCDFKFGIEIDRFPRQLDDGRRDIRRGRLVRLAPASQPHGVPRPPVLPRQPPWQRLPGESSASRPSGRGSATPSWTSRRPERQTARPTSRRQNVIGSSGLRSLAMPLNRKPRQEATGSELRAEM